MMNKLKCLIVGIVIGHKDTAEGEEVEMVHCLGCDKPVFTRKKWRLL